MSATPDVIVWGYATEEHPEEWSGMCASREEAIAEGRIALGAGEGDCPFWLQRGRRPDAGDFGPSTCDLQEMLGERAYDNARCDAAAEFPDADLAPLEILIAEWLNANVKVDFWIADGEPECVNDENIEGDNT